jgi:hypothetical protein
MTVPLRHAADLRGHRRPETTAALDRRNALIVETAAKFFPDASSETDAAHRLNQAIDRYACAAWRRERIADVCPSRHDRKINAHCWRILRTIDRVPSARSIRSILARAAFRCQPIGLQCGPSSK